MFSLKKVRDRLWHLEFDLQYDLTMTFIRYSEYYEGKEAKGRKLELIDLIEMFSKNGKFTYFTDWSGFNIKSKDVFKIHKEGISDLNRYDEMMLVIFKFILAKEGADEFYVIGTSQDDPDKNGTFNHELAHGIYYVDKEYNKKATELVEKLPPKVKKKIFSVLKSMGYHDYVLVDEANAYLSTGLVDKIDTEEIKSFQVPFIKLFNKYSKGLRKKVPKNA